MEKLEQVLKAEERARHVVADAREQAAVIVADAATEVGRIIEAAKAEAAVTAQAILESATTEAQAAGALAEATSESQVSAERDRIAQLKPAAVDAVLREITGG